MSSAEKDGFEDFMLKEIFEQPKSIRETIGARLPKGEKIQMNELDFTKEYMESLKRIYVVACGTAMHAGPHRKRLPTKKTARKFSSVNSAVQKSTPIKL